MIDEFDFYEEPEEYEPVEEPDAYFLDAQKDVKELFENDKEAVFYLRQL
jgi:hypothetical protein